MNAKMQWNAYRVVGSIALINEIAWMILSALYEQGVWIVVSPLISLVGAIYIWCYLHRLAWAYRWSIYYAIGTGMVMGAFIGESAAYYGRYAGVMQVVEATVLFSAVGMLIIYFLPDIKAYFKLIC